KGMIARHRIGDKDAPSSGEGGEVVVSLNDSAALGVDVDDKLGARLRTTDAHSPRGVEQSLGRKPHEFWRSHDPRMAVAAHARCGDARRAVFADPALPCSLEHIPRSRATLGQVDTFVAR